MLYLIIEMCAQQEINMNMTVNFESNYILDND